jgi:hypothetical protein
MTYDVAGPHFSVIRALAREGLVPNEPWVAEHCTEAVELIYDKNLHLTAMIWAAVHKYGIDYIRQAPVLVLASHPPQGSGHHDHGKRMKLAKHIFIYCQTKQKLRDVMTKYDVAAPLRRINGHNFRRIHRDTLLALSKINPSTLSQCIPDVKKQLIWIENLNTWHYNIKTRHELAINLPICITEWGVKNVGTTRAFHIEDLMDYVVANAATFNFKWNLAQALEASRRWHEETSQRSQEQDFFARHGIEWKEEIKNWGLLITMKIGELTFEALNSGEKLYVDGKIMHHCVGSYSGAVISGRSRIYSISQDEKRIATIELNKPGVRTGRDINDLRGFQWAVAQLKGPCNARPATHVWTAANKFLKEINTK